MRTRIFTILPIVMAVFIGVIGIRTTVANADEGTETTQPAKNGGTTDKEEASSKAADNSDESSKYGDKIYLKNGRIVYGKIYGKFRNNDEEWISIWTDESSWREDESDIIKVEKRYRKPTGLALKAKDDCWGDAKSDLQTQLIPMSTEFCVGKPMEFALLLKNTGELKWYDAQGLSQNTLSIKDSSGKEVYCKIDSHQTCGSEEPLDKGEINVLFSKRNISQEYVLAKPGLYTVQFRGGRLGIGGATLPASNVLTISVKEGEPLKFDQIVLDLEASVPDKQWHISGYSDFYRGAEVFAEVNKFILLRHPESHLKKDIVKAEVWLSTKQLPDDDKEEGTKPLSLGQNDQGYFYAIIPNETSKVWPTVKADIIKALAL